MNQKKKKLHRVSYFPIKQVIYTVLFTQSFGTLSNEVRTNSNFLAGSYIW